MTAVILHGSHNAFLQIFLDRITTSTDYTEYLDRERLRSLRTFSLAISEHIENLIAVHGTRVAYPGTCRRFVLLALDRHA
jgi:hypothetical protein